MDILSFTGEQILAIQLERPDKLFDAKDLVHQARQLISKWHPDRHNNDDLSNKVFMHLKNLKEKGLEQLGSNTWRGPNSVLFTTADKKKFKIGYKVMHPFELGKVYIGYEKIVYVIDTQFEKLFDNAINQIKSIRYPNDKFKTEFEKYLPSIVSIQKDTSIGHVLVLNKTKDVILLKDLIDYLPDNKILPRHVAWILNSILNTICFLDHIGININAISVSNIFVSPEYHSTLLLNGWWYATKQDAKLLALPLDVLDVLSSKIMTEKSSKLSHNLITLRALGLECLGDKTKTGSMLLKDPTVPKELLGWLRSPPTNSPVTDFELLGKALHQAWGKREFVNFDVDISKIY
jgi:hypothetical protein